MREFKDSEGAAWRINLTVGSITHVRDTTGGVVNLLEPAKGSLHQRLSDDLLFFWEVLWRLVEDQAAANACKDAADFGRRMGPEALVDAHDKFFAEWADFFRKLQRHEKATALEATQTINRRAMEAVRNRLDKEAPAMCEAVASKIDEALNKEFGNWRDSLASIPVGTPGGSSIT